MWLDNGRWRPAGPRWLSDGSQMTPTVSEHVLHADAGFIVNTIVFAIGFIIFMAADMDPAMTLADCR